MFRITKPSKNLIADFIARCDDSNYTYPYIGATQNGFRRSRKRKGTISYNVDHHSVVIGNGDKDWESAKKAIVSWKMFEMPWVQLCWPDTPIEEGQNVAILIRHFEFYSLNAARIVYVIDKWDWFGFAYGTLSDHGESGEERFTVRLDRENGDVIYDLYAFSRPNHFAAKLGYPLTRMLQKYFAVDSKAAMLRAIKTIG